MARAAPSSTTTGLGAVLLVLGAACAAPPASTTTPAPAPQLPATPMSPAMIPTTAARAWFDLAAGVVKTDGAPKGLYIEGAVQDGAFVPSSDVLGDGAVGAPGHPGYLELATGSFMRAEEARTPVAPYVEGAMTEQGFVPGSRKVVRFAR